MAPCRSIAGLLVLRFSWALDAGALDEAISLIQVKSSKLRIDSDDGASQLDNSSSLDAWRWLDSLKSKASNAHRRLAKGARVRVTRMLTGFRKDKAKWSKVEVEPNTEGRIHFVGHNSALLRTREGDMMVLGNDLKKLWPWEKSDPDGALQVPKLPSASSEVKKELASLPKISDDDGTPQSRKLPWASKAETPVQSEQSPSSGGQLPELPWAKPAGANAEVDKNEMTGSREKSTSSPLAEQAHTLTAKLPRLPWARKGDSEEATAASEEPQAETRRSAKRKEEKLDNDDDADEGGAEEKPKLDATKLAWLHVPKAGTSFVNTLVSWGCDQLEDSVLVDESYKLPSGMYVPKFMSTHHDQCEKITHICGGHQPIDDKSCNGWKEHRGHFVGLFRDPQQRLVSGYNHNQHDYSSGEIANATMREYAEAVQGCAVRMLTGFKCSDVDQGVNPVMRDHAIQRLHTGFAFVGLTEEWNLSVCLFHAMFGGECHAREFANVRPGAKHTAELYDVSELKGFKDKFDGAVYAEAKLLFYGSIKRYNVNKDTCRTTICKKVPDAFA